MDRLAHAVILSWGWRRRGIAFGAGAVSALAQPPFFAFPLLWLTFPILVWLIDGAVSQARSGRVRRVVPAFAAGWWFGFGYFLAGLWWIGSAFLVEADQFGWLLPFAVILVPAGLAIFWGLGVALAQLMWSEDWRRVFSLAIGLGAAEWARGTLFTGFPWNAIGYSLTAGEVLMQSAALFGVYGLSIIAVAIFAAPAALAPASPARRRNVALPALAIAALAGLALYGFVRLSQSDVTFAQDTTIRIAQPALDQLQKWDPANKDAVLQTYLDLSAPSDRPLSAGTVLVWPESAFPYALTEEPGVLAAIGELLPDGVTLVTGAYRMEYSGEDRRVFNSIYVIDDEGVISEAYDKIHLVPFGEYVPLPEVKAFDLLRKFAQDGFTPGARRRVLNLPSAPPFSPLICYEAIFPGRVLSDDPRPGFLLNVTNDGWFGRTIGPYQHFHQARVRAVEEGLPLVRAANTGISAVIDANGRLLASAALGESAMIEARLPAAIEAPLYVQWRERIALLLLAVFASLVAIRILYRVPQL